METPAGRRAIQENPAILLSGRPSVLGLTRAPAKSRHLGFPLDRAKDADGDLPRINHCHTSAFRIARTSDTLTLNRAASVGPSLPIASRERISDAMAADSFTVRRFLPWVFASAHRQLPGS
jgi:hypothetical protein